MLRFLKMAAMSGIPFGLVMGIFFAFQIGNLYASFTFGLVCGLVFGLTLAAFAGWQRSRFMRMDPCAESERLLKQGPANHFSGWEGVGGWLYLTDKRLLFRSHRYNVQNHELSTPLAEVLQAQPCSTFWLIPNGLRVVTAQGTERFVVEGSASWVEEIRQAKTQPS